MKLYYHKTDGGAEYLMDKFIICLNGEKEGIIKGANYIVRIDGDITKDAELSIREGNKIAELKDKVSKRNMQIKDLKERLEDSIDRTKLSETLNFYLQNMELEDKIMENVL